MGTVLRALFGVRGRINRTTYWRRCFAIGVLQIALLVGLVVLAMAGVDHWIVLGLALLSAAVTIAPLLTLGVRRANDRNRGPWIYLAYLVVPTAVEMIGDIENVVALVVIANLIDLWVLIDIGLRRGTAGPNAYGPDPSALEAVSA